MQRRRSGHLHLEGCPAGRMLADAACQVSVIKNRPFAETPWACLPLHLHHPDSQFKEQQQLEAWEESVGCAENKARMAGTLQCRKGDQLLPFVPLAADPTISLGTGKGGLEKRNAFSCRKEANLGLVSAGISDCSSSSSSSPECNVPKPSPAAIKFLPHV